MNKMREVRIEKVVINIGVGAAGEKLVKAQKVIDLVTKRKSVQTLSKRTIRDWGIRKNMPIGAKVTIRGKDAEDFIKKALSIRNNTLPSYCFDPQGNFSFGITDYTEFEGMKYNPEIGVVGMDINVTLSRAGYRVMRRRIAPRRIPASHRVTKDDGIAFAREKLGMEVIE
jgi:large subunit ribosomal protein L5